MPKVRKRRIPITSSTPLKHTSSTPAHTRTIIRRFHVLLKRRAQLQSLDGAQEGLREVEREMEELGGLSAYQRMSSIGQGTDRGGGCEGVLIAWLREMGLSPLSRRNTSSNGGDHSNGANRPLRLLDVGALKPDNYASCTSWIECTPIDLRSRHPAILEQDFLAMDEETQKGRWNIISLSLVLNFVPRPKDRGRMLRMSHSMLIAGGLLFLALPLACVQNSRYLTLERLEALMASLGFAELRARRRQGGRLAYWLYRKVDQTNAEAHESFAKKMVLRDGPRNNFSILLA